MLTGKDNNHAALAFSLYLHIPYCQSKCPYCDFNSHAVASWPEDDYVRALVAEIERRAGEAPWTGRQLKTIFFGGGTPSLFRPESIAAVLDRGRTQLRTRARRRGHAGGKSGHGRRGQARRDARGRNQSDQLRRAIVQ